MAVTAIPATPGMDNITEFKINGTTPFWSGPDAADQLMDQSHALLTLLS